MTTPSQPQPPPQQQPPQSRVVRKLTVDVVDARNLLPKDGQGSASPYVIVDFDGQKKRTSTKFRDLNPSWNEQLDFVVSDPSNMEVEELEVEVFNDKRFGNGSGRKNHFLGRVKLYGSQFSKRGEEGLVYFSLEKKSVFSWIRGEIGLRIYYYDEMVEDEPQQQQPPPEDGPPPEQQQQQQQENSAPAGYEEGRVYEVPSYADIRQSYPDDSQLPPVVVIEELPPIMYGGQPPMTQHMRGGQPPIMYGGQPPMTQHMNGGQPPMMQHMSGGQNPMMQHMSGGQNPMIQHMRDGQPPMMNGGQPPMMNGGQPPMMNGGQPPTMNGGHPQMMRGGQPPMMQPAEPINGDQPPHVVHMQGEQPPMIHTQGEPPPGMHMHSEPPPNEVQYPPEMRKMQMGRPSGGERVRFLKKPNGDYSPRAIKSKINKDNERIHPYDLVEPMQYLFVRIVKARGLAPNESPYVKIRSASHLVQSKPASYRPGEPTDSPEWNQVFALNHNRPDSANATLEISAWDTPSENFLGGVCFDLSDVPMRDQPDSPLAPQWYRLEGGATDQSSVRVSGDIQLSVWIGTQADDAFPEAWSSDAPHVSHTRSKVYQSPKLWYLRVTVVEAQDLHIAPNLPPLTAPEIRVKVQLVFQSARTRRGSMSNHSASFHWNEDLVFVAGEPLEDSLILLVEDRTNKEPVLLGHVMIPVSSIEQRIDDRHIASKWFGLEGNGGGGGGGPPSGPNSYGGSYCGRIQLRLCLEGGYHVLDEAAHVCSDFRPTAKQLWKPAVGILELGILGARGLLPMKTKGGGKGSTDAYCVAKYGKKWVRTRTITDSFDPRWNEQYTWQVYDPSTVLTVGVFDNWRMFADMQDDKPDCRIGKIRIRVSMLESNKVYTNSYPLLILLRSGLKKMGEIELAVRFVCPSLLPDTCSVYGQPLLPKMHYLRPLGVAQQEALRGAATKMVAAWLVRSEPPLGPEVVKYMLDTDSHKWSMRKSKANWFRIVAVLAWAIGLAKWFDEIRRWRNPVTTVLVHVLYLVLVWYPELVVPTGFLYVVLIGIWYYRFRPKIPAGMDLRLSQAESVDPDELDEEFDTIPSSRNPDIVRARYDRLRILAARVQTVLGDFAAQGERIQALVSWRDPRATKLFIGVCLAITLILYVVPPKMVAVALGFYYLRHPMFRDPMPAVSLNFFRRLPSLSDRLM